MHREQFVRTCTLLIEVIEWLDRITKSEHDVERGDNRESNCSSSTVCRAEAINRLIAVRIETDTFLFVFRLLLNLRRHVYIFHLLFFYRL